MMRPHPPPAARAQHGVAALGTALVLLFAMTLIAFFAHRALLFEQRASANQYRAARAFEAAEAGLEWAAARLNDPRRIDASCQPATGATASFRARYAPMSVGLAFAPVTAARPGCSLGAASLACSCPGDGSPPAQAEDAPGFTVEMAAVPGDPESLRIVSRGCSGLGAQCVPGSDRGPADATATVQALLKLRPGIRSLPVAAVTAGGPATLGGGLRLANTDVRTQGRAVHAAAAVGLAAGVGVGTLPGSPVAQAVLADDEFLARLAAQDADGSGFFAAWFGLTPEQFAAAPTTHRLGGCQGAGCAIAIQAAWAEGHDSFVVDGDLQLDAGGWPGAAIGTPERPLLLVVRGRLVLRGGARFHGLIYVDAAPGSASIDAQVDGALVARGPLDAHGSGTLTYDPAILTRLAARVGVVARVPGSWQDGRCAGADPALTCDAGT